MSRKGTPYDNALIEYFYQTIKRELINDAQFGDIDQAQMEIFVYIETQYNTKRIHSALDYRWFCCKVFKRIYFKLKL